MNKFLWMDAKVDKPKNYDPVIALTSDGQIVIAQWNYKTGHWYDRDSDETFDNAVWWSDFHLPATWNISDDYYEGDPYWE